MHGVVSLLDCKHYKLVEDLWSELAGEFAVSGINVQPYPHVSYQVATRYKVKSLESVLRLFAASKTSFKVRTGGLGIFTGPQPVIYIPVVRSPELTEFHQALWQEISSTGSDFLDYYRPAHWVPHITIGFGDMKKGDLSQIVRLLVERDFNWEITVDNVALIYNPSVPRFGSILRLLSPEVFGTKISHFALSRKEMHA
jgi:2'-5' RNA ligase superfamily